MSAETLERLAAWEAIGRSPFFGPLSPEAGAEIVGRLQRQEFPAGAVIVREADDAHAHGYYLIASGAAEVWVRKGARPDRSPQACQVYPPDPAAWAPDPRRHTFVARLGSGQGFGEMSLLLGGPPRATVRAATDLVLYTLDSVTFKGVLNQHRGLALALEEEMLLRAAAAFLGAASPFASLPADALRWLAVRLLPVPFPAGEDIVREGEPGDAFYIIHTGQAEMLGRRSDGSLYRVGLLGPGEAFGEQALLATEPHPVTVRALAASPNQPGGRVEVLRLSRDAFLETLQQFSERHNYFIQLALQRQRPQRIASWQMERQVGRGGESVAVLKDTQTNRYLKLSEPAAFLWEQMDGEHTVRDLALAYFAQYKAFGLDAVLTTMLQLHAAGFLHIQRLDRVNSEPDPGRSIWRRSLAKLGSLISHHVTHYWSLPDVDRLITWLYRYLLRPLYTRPFLVLQGTAMLIGVALYVRYLAGGGLPGVDVRSFALVLPWALPVHLFLHEVAHAVTAKHFGREVHKAGIGLYLLHAGGLCGYQRHVDGAAWAARRHRLRRAVYQLPSQRRGHAAHPMGPACRAASRPLPLRHRGPHPRLDQPEPADRIRWLLRADGLAGRAQPAGQGPGLLGCAGVGCGPGFARPAPDTDLYCLWCVGHRLYLGRGLGGFPCLPRLRVGHGQPLYACGRGPAARLDRRWAYGRAGTAPRVGTHAARRAPDTGAPEPGKRGIKFRLTSLWP
jgi:CRP-like cAMP-binding protein